MSGKKNTPVRRNNRRNERSRSLSDRFVGFLFTTVASGALFAGRFMVRNPVLTSGATAFLVVMSFVSANALWYQPQPHDNVFFRTRPDLVFTPTPKPGFLSHDANKNDADSIARPEIEERLKSAHAEQQTAQQFSSLDSVELGDELPALPQNADLEIAKIQQKLRSLGLYDGAVDGLSGPKTRQAIEQWQLLQQKANGGSHDVKPYIASGSESSVRQQNIETIIQIAIPKARPKSPDNRGSDNQGVDKPIIDKMTTSNVSPKREDGAARSEAKRPQTVQATLATNSTPVMSQDVTSQDIVRVQAGLKAFGNDLIIVDGVAGRSTQDAIREFQKLFDMQITGQVDAQLINKMREIGLIS